MTGWEIVNAAAIALGYLSMLGIVVVVAIYALYAMEERGDR